MKNDIKKGDMVVIIKNNGPAIFDNLIGWFGEVVSDKSTYFVEDNLGFIQQVVGFYVRTKNFLNGSNEFVCLQSELMKINPDTLQIKQVKTKETCLE